MKPHLRCTRRLRCCLPCCLSDRLPATADTIKPVATDIPAGDFYLDKAHASLIFRVSHLGFSNYTARFKSFDADLKFDPANPAAMSISVTVDPKSMETDFPFKTYDFNAVLYGKDWLDAAQFPTITFVSRKVTLVAPEAAMVEGNLTLHGVTKPITLEVTFNGGWKSMQLDPGGARIGFSAKTVFKRSEFGIAYGVPAPGTKMGVSDEVDVAIEAEFNSVKITEMPKMP